jgi:hypothetical protein
LEQLEKKYHQPCTDRHGRPSFGRLRENPPAVQHLEGQQTERKFAVKTLEPIKPDSPSEPVNIGKAETRSSTVKGALALNGSSGTFRTVFDRIELLLLTGPCGISRFSKV